MIIRFPKARPWCLFVSLVALTLGLVGCGQSSTLSQADAVRAWIKQDAIALTTTDATAPLDDLQPLQQRVGTATIVGLGEETHGTHEFLTLSERMVEALVQNMGFSMIAIEGSWSAGARINTYVLTDQGTAADALRQLHEWIWNTQEMLDLVTWMRAYNADAQHTQKVRFAGFDIQDIQADTFDSVIAYIRAVAPDQAAAVVHLYEGIRPDPAIPWDQSATNYIELPESTKQQYVTQAQQVYTLLQTNQAAYTAHSSAQAYAAALRNAQVIAQSTQLGALDPNNPQDLPVGNNLRDAAMASNVAWLHTSGDGGAKMILLAHDGHIGVANRDGYTTMGMHLRQDYAAGYLALGTSFYQGMFHAAGASGNTFYEKSPPAQSYNAALGSAGIPLYLLDLRSPPGGTVRQWLDTPQDFHKIGGGYDPAHPNADDVTVPLGTFFDLVIAVQQTTASQLIPLSE